MPPVFEWDERKARANLKKHGIDFAEATLVFADKLAQIFPDEDHSEDEQREIIIGHGRKHTLLVVSFTERRKELIRIISARRATRREQRDYEEYLS
jgi:uncharacterized DUF497 family protein